MFFIWFIIYNFNTLSIVLITNCLKKNCICFHESSFLHFCFSVLSIFYSAMLEICSKATSRLCFVLIVTDTAVTSVVEVWVAINNSDNVTLNAYSLNCTILPFAVRLIEISILHLFFPAIHHFFLPSPPFVSFFVCFWLSVSLSLSLSHSLSFSLSFTLYLSLSSSHSLTLILSISLSLFLSLSHTHSLSLSSSLSLSYCFF